MLKALPYGATQTTAGYRQAEGEADRFDREVAHVLASHDIIPKRSKYSTGVGAPSGNPRNTRGYGEQHVTFEIPEEQIRRLDIAVIEEVVERAARI